jgi:O-antigen/teichoic acid export membrane protein
VHSRAFALNFVYYFISGVANRLIVFISLLIFVNLLTPEEFGIFSLILGNALLFQICLGSWLSSGVRREFSISSRDGWRPLINSAAWSIFGVAVLLLLVSLLLIYFRLTSLSAGVVFSTAALAFSLIVYETVQALQNAMNLASKHAIFATIRNTIALGLGTIAALVTQNPVIVISAYVFANIVTVIMIVLGSPQHILSIRPDFDIIDLQRIYRFGLDSTLLYGYYTIIIAMTKNGFALSYGVSQAGMSGIVIDFLFAPLAFMSNVMSLTYMPKLYEKSNSFDPGEAAKEVKRYITLHLMLILLYIVGLILTMSFIFELLLPRTAAEFASDNLIMIAFFTSVITMLVALNTIFITQFRRLPLRVSLILGLVLHGAAMLVVVMNSLPIHWALSMMLGAQIGASIVSSVYYTVWARRMVLASGT